MGAASLIKQHQKLKHFFQGVAVFACLSVLIHFAVTTERDRIEQNLRVQIAQNAIGIASRLETELNANIFLAHGMVAFVTAVQAPKGSEFEAALKSIHQSGRHVRNVAVAPGNRISHIYPLKGNEAALGLYYPDVPDQWPAVEKAISSRDTLLAGPVKLRQGGMGLISRTPLFSEEGRYWGILSLVLDADSLFKAAGLKPETSSTRFALRGKDGTGEQGEMILGEASIFDADSVRVPISTPGGSWSLAAIPVGGWASGQSHLVALEIPALIAALLPAVLFYRYQRGRLRIATSEQRLRAFMETARDGVVVIDDSGIIHEFNQAAEALFGYTAPELTGTSLNKLMPETEARQHDAISGIHTIPA